MKALEQLVVRARTRLREGRARAGFGGRPARLVVRLDDLDAPIAVPASTLKLDAWFDAVIRVVEWSGPLPVTIVARADHRLVAEMVRFAHRLECPTLLRTTAAGMTVARAEELVDCGLDRVALRVAGVSEEAQATLGETVADTRHAIAALQGARASRGVPLDIVLEIPFDSRTAHELRPLVEEARTVGVDGVRVAAPWRGGPFDAGAIDALTWFESQSGAFFRGPSPALARQMTGDSPGAPRAKGACPVGSLRLELLPDATLLACPFKGETARLGDSMAPAWQALEAHRAAIKRCDRACAHPELSA